MNHRPSGSDFAPLAAIAASQLGIAESAPRKNSGPAILKYQQATWLAGQGWPWCAAFVCWCVLEFLRAHPKATSLKISQRPRTPSAFGLRTWGRENGCLVFGPRDGKHRPQPGDIVVFTFSHCAIVAPSTSSSASRSTRFHAIEGNTNDEGSREGYEVALRTRDLSTVLCFVRLPAHSPATSRA